MTIKDLIKASGMTQNGFAAAYGIPWRTVSNWCRGVNACPDYVVQLLERAEEGRKLRELKNMRWWVVEDNGNSLEAQPLPYTYTRSQALAAAESWYEKHFTRREQKALEAFYIALAPEELDDDGPTGCIDFDRQIQSVEVLQVLRHWEEITELMDDEIREALHADGYDTKVEFFEAYQAEHLAKFGASFTI